MDYLPFVPASDCAQAASQPGSCRLAAGQAVRMRARQDGRLRVMQGPVWLTFDNAAHDASVQAGDHVLSAGDSVLLRAGQSMVMQAWARQGQAQVQWEAAPVAKALPVFGAASRRGVRLSRLARLVQRLARGPASAPLACGR